MKEWRYWDLMRSLLVWGCPLEGDIGILVLSSHSHLTLRWTAQLTTCSPCDDLTNQPWAVQQKD